MNATVNPQNLKQRFVVVDGYFIEPAHIHKQDNRSVTLTDGRRFER